MRLVLWHLFLLLCSHCFILLLHLFLRHIFCLLILFVLLVLLVLLLLSNTWQRLKWFGDFHRTYLKKPLQSTRSGIHSEVASNPSIPTKSYISYGGHKSQASRADTAAPPASTCKGTGTLHLHLNQRTRRRMARERRGAGSSVVSMETPY